MARRIADDMDSIREGLKKLESPGDSIYPLDEHAKGGSVTGRIVHKNSKPNIQQVPTISCAADVERLAKFAFYAYMRTIKPATPQSWDTISSERQSGWMGMIVELNQAGVFK